MSPRMVAAILRSIAQSSVTHGKWNLKGSILSFHNPKANIGMFLKLATKSDQLQLSVFVSLCQCA